MDNSTHDNDKLVLYLDGELEDKEKEELERQLATDPAMKEKLEDLKLTKQAIRLAGVRQKVGDIHREMMGEFSTSVKQVNFRKRIIRYTATAAAAVALIFIGIAGYNYITLTSKKVFAANYQAYELSTVRGNENNESIIEEAYREKKYAEVAAMTLGRPFTMKEIFLRGLSFLETGDSKDAVSELQKVAVSDTSGQQEMLMEQAEYYLALAYIANKDYDAALELLRKIKDDPRHLYHEKITAKLIRQVKMLGWK